MIGDTERLHKRIGEIYTLLEEKENEIIKLKKEIIELKKQLKKADKKVIKI